MVVLIYVSTMVPGLSVYAQGSWNDYDSVRKVLKSEVLESRIGFLTDSLCLGRATGTRGGVEASFWMAGQFEKVGLKKLEGSWYKPFTTATGAVGRNVVGLLPGRDGKVSNKYIIVGAHFDHIGVLDGRHYPGADANASGTIAMLTLAEMFKSIRDTGRNYDTNIIFVGFDGKETDMAGSQALWRMIEDGKVFNPLTGRAITPEDISMMVNIDQIGATLSPLRPNRKDYIIMLGNESIPSYKRDLLYTCNRLFMTDLDLGYDYYGSENFTKIFYRLSDQRVFVDNNIPSVLFTSGITMRTNKTYDNAAGLDYPVFRRRILLMFHWMEKML